MGLIQLYPTAEGETQTMRVERYRNSRYWAVRDAEEMLVCVCLYKRGALEVMRRLQIVDQALRGQKTSYAREDIPSNVVGNERVDDQPENIPKRPMLCSMTNL